MPTSPPVTPRSSRVKFGQGAQGKDEPRRYSGACEAGAEDVAAQPELDAAF